MTQTHYSPPPPTPTSSILLRRIASIAVIILLYTSAVPFTPIAWVVGEIEGAFLLDRFVAGIALICALYFQFALAGLSYPVSIAIPNPFARGSDSYISNGRMGGSRQKSEANAEFVAYYHPSSYWTYMAAEIGLLFVAEFGRMEYLRRIIVFSAVTALWAVGWAITPRSTKLWAWNHIKTLWFFIVLDLVRDIGFGGGRHRRRH
ncbi:hypothetical protein BKA66DRAFT_474172 [Pyrenochaeta sp. MPI-SDFR-AT-0127]|nr:hypothetical protein BKA66DRAFT_474172 [Pyrenochaeta sp. MPI-SDFR-AT-0127]